MGCYLCDGSVSSIPANINEAMSFGFKNKYKVFNPQELGWSYSKYVKPY